MVIVGALILGFALLAFGKGPESMFTGMVGGAEGHVIEYNLNEGKGNFNRIVIDYEDNEFMIPHEEPTRDSYIFNGWKNSSDNNIHYPGSTIVVEEDIVLSAEWRASTHDVRYNLNGGNGNIPNEKVPFDQTFNLTETIPTRDGLHLVGWESSVDGEVYDSGDEVDIKGSTTFTAVWNQNAYGITHDLAGGSTSIPFATVNLEHNKFYTIPTHEPTRVGYVFHGWENSVTGETIDAGAHFKVTDHTVLKAKWSSDSYRLRYDVNGGAYTTNQPELTHYAGYGVTHRTLTNIPTRSGFELVGWKDSRTNSIYTPGSGFSVQGDTELVAEWKAIDFRVAFDLDGGTPSIATQNKAHNETMTVPSEVPTKYGYQFNGWLNNIDYKTYQPKESFTVRDNTTLRAHWLRDRFEIIYDLNGGSGIFDNTSGLYEAKHNIPNHVPSKEGAVFEGWLNSQDSKVYNVGDEIKVTGKTTLTAQWSINDYTVTYDTNGGSGTFLATGVRHGANHAIYGHKPTLTGYNFEGWKINNAGKSYDVGATVRITQDTKFVAQWERKEYSIKYNLSGGSGSHGTEVALYEDLYNVLPEVPTREGYIFNGWIDSVTNEIYQPNEQVTIRNNMNLTAQWSLDSFEVTYNLTGGNGSSAFTEDYPIDYGKNHTILSETPKRLGHHFTGWRNSSDERLYQEGDTVRITDDTLLSAEWTLGEFSVRFDLNGGSVDDLSAFDPITGKHNYTFTIDGQVPILSDDTNKEFIGWKDTSTSEGFVYDAGGQYTIIEDTTLVAQWDYNSYLLIYDENGGNITYPDIIGENKYDVNTEDGHKVIHHPTPPSSEFVFAGWESDVTGERFFEGYTIYPSKKTHLTAQWELREYTLKYDLVGGSGYFPDTALKHNAPLEVNPLSPTKTGYIFKGWVPYEVSTIKDVKDNEDIYHPTDDITASKDTTLYAVWEPEIVQVKYTFINEMTNKGSFSEFVEVDYGSYLTLPTATPLATGSTFVGWSPESPETDRTYSQGQRILIDETFVDFRNMTVTIHSQWELNNHTISFDLNGASKALNPNYTETLRSHNSTYTASFAPIREGFRFDGWRRANGSIVQLGTSFTVTANETLTAQWESTSPTVRYDTNGGVGSGYGLRIPSPVEVVQGEEYEVDVPNMQRAGYAFVGWQNSVTGDITKPEAHNSGDIRISFKMPDEPVVMKAIWSSPISSFTYVDRGSYIEITDYNANVSKDVIIPSHIDKKPVQELASVSFNDKGLTSVYIPDTVRTIGNQAFVSNNISDLRLSNNLAVIEGDVFRWNNLKTVHIPYSVRAIRYNAFADNPMISVSLPQEVVVGFNGIPDTARLDYR